MNLAGLDIGRAKDDRYLPELRYTLRLDRRLTKVLDPELQNITSWSTANRHAAAAALTSGELGKSWKQLPGGHKWLNYFPIYEELLGHLRDRAPKILEIGVYKGASLKLWSGYFGEGTTIVGIDIQPACKRYEDPDNNIFVRIGSQADRAFLRALIDEFGPFDAILDDGSHVSGDQIASFNALFKDGLRTGGVYLVEDLECYFWPADSTGRKQPYSFIDFAAHLAKMMHMQYNKYQYEDFNISNPEVPATYQVPFITKVLGSIRIYDSIVSLQKSLNTIPITQRL
ncbi:MAG: class I SAM-dependent methyltransferase [Alphaproteobacteria bacterium]|nr:class I SAM-dependent methyltransferase [Alphaproteobacteria bacterium]